MENEIIRILFEAFRHYNRDTITLTKLKNYLKTKKIDIDPDAIWDLAGRKDIIEAGAIKYIEKNKIKTDIYIELKKQYTKKILKNNK